MPKNVSVSKTQSGRIIKSRPAHKMRIGTRSSGKSALVMSNKELIDVLDDKNKKRYHNKARKVLLERGVKLDWPDGLTEKRDLESLADELRGDKA